MLAGKDLANPTAFLCAGIDMLHYLHLHEHAMRISNALYKVSFRLNVFANKSFIRLLIIR